MRGVLSYNENKVLAGKAECIHENLYGRKVEHLSFYDKLQGLENFSDRNNRASSKAVHISLNFHPEDKLDNETFTSIAEAYMEKIGFGNQPYLVYRHTDTAHPHLHIVTTNITAKGKRINMFNLGRNQSQVARKEIEKDFNLVIPGSRQPIVKREGNIAEYGKAETKRSITNAVRQALRYRFTSIAQFNAVLQQFHVVADAGKEGSNLNKRRGLLYAKLDKSGKKVGVPIKASSIYGQPTMKLLEKQFKINEDLRAPLRDRLKTIIDKTFKDGKITQRDFFRQLNHEKIYIVLRQNPQGLVYGITFVDNRTKAVFNGSDLGKHYSAKPIFEQLIDDTYGRAIDQRSSLLADFVQELSQVIEAVTESTAEQQITLPQSLRKKEFKKRPKR